MVSLSQDQESLLQCPIFDALYCAEERFEEDFNLGFGFQELKTNDFHEIYKNPLPFFFEHDLFWEDDELVNLLYKEKQSRLIYEEINSDGSLVIVRKEAIKWILKVAGHYGFTALTAVLAVNYYDRFVTSFCFQKDKPWMSQLAAVACLSIAAKVEETQVPLLLDLQVEESKYVFEAKTIQRMELLVLSTLHWKMNPVTPISFFDHIVRRFGFMNNPHSQFLSRCESLLLSIITDYRFLGCLPSVVAAATMIFIIRDIDHPDAKKCKNQLMSVLKISKERIDDCYELILDIIDEHGQKQCHKRKHKSIPGSPNGVINAYFICDSSNVSWVVTPSVSLSPEPLFKRSKVWEQPLGLTPISNASVGAGGIPRRILIP